MKKRDNTKEVICHVCQKSFQKAIKRIKQTEKLNQKHTCSRTCASQISNTKRISIPSTQNAKHTRADKEKYPDRNRARYLVRQAIKNGKLIPPQLCEACIDPCDKIEAHHPDHTQPYLLVWLCKKCHALFDKHKIFGYERDYSKNIKE